MENPVDKIVNRRAIDRKEIVDNHLTEHQKFAYEGAPDNLWFNPERYCWYGSRTAYHSASLVRRPYFTAECLYQKGWFERSLVGEYPFLDFEYRKIGQTGQL